jgi:aryl-alcohol dehydrogenase-like predicted oxidoreductase
MFRQRPEDYFFEAAKAREVGIIVRVPLASGLLTGKFSRSSTFGAGDHRHGNRNGEWFDKGETFAGIPFEKGLEAVDRVESFLPQGYPLTHAALQWILRRPEVSTIIPGASRSEQVNSNLAASEATPLNDKVIRNIHDLYEADIKPLVHQLW